MKANYQKTTAKRQMLKPCLHVKHTCRLAAAAPRHFYGAAPARPPAAPTRGRLKHGAPPPRPATPSSPAGRPAPARRQLKRRPMPRPRSARRRPGPTPRRGPPAPEPRLLPTRRHGDCWGWPRPSAATAASLRSPPAGAVSWLQHPGRAQGVPRSNRVLVRCSRDSLARLSIESRDVLLRKACTFCCASSRSAAAATRSTSPRASAT